MCVRVGGGGVLICCNSLGKQMSVGKRCLYVLSLARSLRNGRPDRCRDRERNREGEKEQASEALGK